MGQSKGSKKGKSKGRNKREFKCCHECGKSGLRSAASVSEASKRSLEEARCVGMVNVDLNPAGGWSSVAGEKSQDSGWNRFVCCSDCVRSFSLVRNEKLQVLYGSEYSKGERHAPRWVILVRWSEKWQRPCLGGAGGRGQRAT